jgi:predicted transcriptional regulator
VNPAGAEISAATKMTIRPSLRAKVNPGYTASMKTAVSLPDELFQEAEATARRLRVSRSELYAKAIKAFLTQQNGDAITERLNDLYSRHAARVDPELHRAQLNSLTKDSW